MLAHGVHHSTGKQTSRKKWLCKVGISVVELTEECVLAWFVREELKILERWAGKDTEHSELNELLSWECRI